MNRYLLIISIFSQYPVLRLLNRLLVCRYVDVILQLIEEAGDFVSDDIWYRVVQFVTNNDDLQVLADFLLCSGICIGHL